MEMILCTLSLMEPLLDPCFKFDDSKVSDYDEEAIEIDFS